MISKFDLAKALYEQAKLIAGSNSYLLIPNGEAFEPDPNATYIQEFPLYGDDTPRGIEDDSPDMQIGIYQLSINTPKSNEGSNWQALAIAKVLQLGFGRGTELIFNQQMVRMRSSSLTQLDDDDTHKIYALSITFTVIN